MNIMLVYLESEKLDYHYYAELPKFTPFDNNWSLELDYHYYAELPKFTPFDNNWSLDYDGKERRVGKK